MVRAEVIETLGTEGAGVAISRNTVDRIFLHRFDEQRLTLRIHRGRGSVHNGSNNGSPRSPESNSRCSVKREKIKISVSYPSTETLNTKCNTLERTPSRCSQVSVHYSNGQTQSQLCPTPRSTHLKVIGRDRAKYVESCSWLMEPLSLVAIIRGGSALWTVGRFVKGVSRF